MKIFDLFLAATRVAAASTFILTATVCHAEPWFNESELDTLFAAKNWKELSAALSRPDRDEKKALHWMKTKLVSSGSYLIALLYARDLWLVGSAVPAADPNKDLRISSGAVTLYVYAIITIDGQKCEDRSAPAHRLDQLFQARKETLNYVKALPEDLKTKVINLAVSLEAKTAAARRDDDLVCRDGMAQIRAGLDHGVKHDAPTPPGQVGKTVAVEAPPGWRPTLLLETDYLPKQQVARAKLKNTLETFMQ